MVERNTSYDNMSASHFKGENGMQIVETNADLPILWDQPNNALEPKNPPPDDLLPPESDKRIQKPSQLIKDLLEGHGTWSNNPNDPVIPLGVQLSAEGGAYDDNLTNWLDDVPTHVEGYAFATVTGVSEALEPWSLAKTKRGGNWLLWEKAIHKELVTLQHAGTWKLVDAPQGANVIGSKWVFQAKKDAVENVVRYKARLVAQARILTGIRNRLFWYLCPSCTTFFYQNCSCIRCH